MPVSFAARSQASSFCEDETGRNRADNPRFSSPSAASSPFKFRPRENGSSLQRRDRFFASLTRGQLYLTILHTIYKLLLAYMKLLLVYGDWLVYDSSVTFPSFLFFRYYRTEKCFLEKCALLTTGSCPLLTS